MKFSNAENKFRAPSRKEFLNMFCNWELTKQKSAVVRIRWDLKNRYLTLKLPVRLGPVRAAFHPVIWLGHHGHVPSAMSSPGRGTFPNSMYFGSTVVLHFNPQESQLTFTFYFRKEEGACAERAHINQGQSIWPSLSAFRKIVGNLFP